MRLSFDLPAITSFPARIRSKWVVVLPLISIGAYALHIAFALWQKAPDIHPDNIVYFTVGRGILNGLMPYTDIFEWKPPMIFFISALSLKVTGGYGGAQIFGTLVPLLPISLSYFAKERLWAILASSAVMLFVIHETRNVQVEAFGAIWACCYVVVMLWKTKWKILLASAFVTAAVLTKEPIALIILASSLALYPRIRVKECIFVLIGSVVLWFIVMGSFGYVDPYFHFNIPVTYLGRADNSLPILDGLRIWKIIPTFTSLVFVLLLLASLRKSWLLIPALYLATFAGGIAYDDPFRKVDIIIIASFFLALILHKNKLNTIIILLLPFLMLPPASFERSALGVSNEEIAQAKVIDGILDDCGIEQYLYFGRPRTFTVASMKHSPMGPGVFISDLESQVPDLVNSYIVNIHQADIVLFERATKVMGSEKFVYDLLKPEITKKFTTEPWPCGKKFVTGEYALLYRKKPIE
jgi:hypothetical protein